VSNVLNRPEHVTPELVARVSASIDTLGFVRNRAASKLAAGVSDTVGVILVDLSNSYFTDMVKGAERYAAEAGKILVIGNSDIDENRQRSYLRYFEEEQVSGILVAPLNGVLTGQARTSMRQPLVILDAASQRHDHCAVSTNNVVAGRLAAQHLLDLGRRRLAFAGGPVGRSRALADRLLGAEEAVAAVPGATLEYLPSDGVQVADGRLVGDLLATRPADQLPEGIVAAADLLALGIMQVLSRSTRARFPEDVALVACDDNRMAYDNVVPISTVDLPGLAMGETGMRLLLDELTNQGVHEHKHVVLDPTLTARESTLGRRTPG
uniref:LacI family DNA-binding transcriptional regulator n=1 Tax=Conyzicola sp. TaxID=1969404 RepID=UPI00398A3B33